MEITAIGFVVFLVVVAAVTFFVLKKAIKMALRAAIVALILLIAVVGGVSLWMFGADKTSEKPPANVKKSR
jgi:flagellar basal body-associated protein FliL